MQLVSINIAEKAKRVSSGSKSKTGIFKDTLLKKALITGRGVEGDTIADLSVHGGADQAVYLYSAEDYAWWSAQLGQDIAPGTFGENLTISGVGDYRLVIGDRLRINTVLLEISAPRTPCFKLAARMNDPQFGKTFVKAQRPGAYARVIEEGEVRIGDAVELIQTTEDYATTLEVFVEWHLKKRSIETLQKALRSPIAAYHKAKILEWSQSMAAKSS